MRAHHALFAVVAISSLAGCGTTYMPRPSPRIVEVTAGYTHDGVVEPRGFFGSGLVQIVEGHPKAEEHALTSRRLQIAGFVLDMTGLAMVGGGAGLAGGQGDSGGGGIGLIVAVVGASLVLTGLFVGAPAGAHTVDAINIYNDDVATPGAPAPPAACPPAPVCPAPTPPPLAPRRGKGGAS